MQNVDTEQLNLIKTTRTIRSFVRRSGRMTVAQQRAWETLWDRYGVELNNQLNLNELFGRTAPKHLEIGFGNGDALVTMANQHLENDYLGIEVHRPGIGHLLMAIEAAQLTNVKIICADVMDVLQHGLPAQCLDVVYLFFPDPWTKKRHHKRRLVQAEFLELLAKKVKPGSHLYLATDWQDYAQHILQLLTTTPHWKNTIENNGFAPRPPRTPLTKFEKRGINLGHEVWDFLIVNCVC
jgi:tRNA (guanine-N7-)-methyltransferase